ncbi:MAG: HipA domain-containing protein [Acidimicrobiales bacterium]
MSSDRLVVVMGDVVAGVLSRDSRAQLHFVYDDAYRDGATATALSISMPLAVREHPHRVVSPWLWGLLPDNDAVLSRWARHFQVSVTSAFSLHGTPIGEDCAGAARFVVPDRLADVLSRDARVQHLSDEEVGERLAELRRDTTSWLGRGFDGRFSLAGAQAKMALAWHDGRWGLAGGSTPTTHILKPAVIGLDDHDLNEHLCLSAARRAGLAAARSAIRRFADESAIVVERYDRDRAGVNVTRIHQEDACQALGVSPRAKYQAEGGPSASDIASLISRAWTPVNAQRDRDRFLDALIWNWIIAGTDAHAKNFSFLLDAGDVRLAPLYDVASALPYGVHERKLRFVMKIGDDYDVYTRRDPWPDVARSFGVAYEHVRPRVQRLLEVAPDALREATLGEDVVELNSALPARLLSLVADRVTRLVQLVSK